MVFKDFLYENALKTNIELDNEALNQFNRYKEMLLEWNNKINLTAITDEKGIALKHFIDSIYPVNEFTSHSSIIDVGIGAGFPTYPLKIVNKTLKITALDSLNKRLKFLDEIAKELNFMDINLIHGRAEDFGQNKQYREKFDYATARAVAGLNILVELCLPFIKVGGHFVVYKGDKWKEELNDSKNAIKILGGEISGFYEYNLPEINDKRAVILIKKIKKTPKEFPRKPGLPNKKPLT